MTTYTYRVSKLGLLVLTLGFSVFSATPASALELTKDFNLEGYLVDSSDVPLAGPVSIVFKIYNPAGNCLLFEETQSSVAVATDGFFSTKVGSGARNTTNDGGEPWRKIFQNEGQVRASGTNCASGYTPAANHGRSLQVTVNGVTLSPSISMSSVPMATVAESLQGKVVSDFLAAPLSAGTSGQVLSTDGAGVLSWVNQSVGNSGTVTSVSAGTGLLGGPITSAGTLAVDVGTTAGKIVQLNGSAQLPAVDGSLLTGIVASGVSGTVAITNGGTGASTVAAARTNLGLGSAATANLGTASGDLFTIGSIPNCLASEKLQMSAGPIYSFSCVADNSTDTTKLPLAGGTMTGAIDMGANNILNVGHITMSPQKTINLGTYTNVQEAALLAALAGIDKGKTWFNSDTNQIKYWDGTAAQTLGVSGSGLTSLNGITVSSQSFATGTAGADFSISSSGSSHTFNLPNSSATNRGLLSSADWSTFSNKENAIAAGTAGQYYRGDKTWSPLSSSVVPEGTNFYYTDARARLAISGTAPVSYNSATGAISMGAATSVANGYLSSGDWINFNNKLSSTLTSGQILVGNGSNVASGVNLSGDATVTNTGIMTVSKIQNRMVSATTPANGQVLVWNGGTTQWEPGTPGGGSQWTTNGSNIYFNTGNVGIGTTTPTSMLQVAGGIQLSDDAATCIAGKSGTIKYFSGALSFCDGTSWQTLGVSGAGITSLNGQTGASQSLLIGTGGTYPNYSTGINTHTLNIPMASVPSVTAGLISKTDYDAFTSKLGPASTFAGDVSGTASTTVVNKINGQPVSLSAPSMGQVIKYTGSNWVNSSIIPGDISGLGTAATATVGTAPNNVVALDGIGKLPAVDGSSLMNVTANKVSAIAGSPNFPSVSFSSDSDTGWFSAGADNLAASTAGIERMRIDAAGNVGIGTTLPAAGATLHVNGPVRIGGTTSTNISQVSSVTGSNPFGLTTSIAAGATANGTCSAAPCTSLGTLTGMDTVICTPDGSVPPNLIWSCNISGSFPSINAFCAGGTSCTGLSAVSWRITVIRF